MTEYEHTVADVDEALTELINDRRGDFDTDDAYQRGYQRALLLARCIVRDPDHLDEA